MRSFLCHRVYRYPDRRAGDKIRYDISVRFFYQNLTSIILRVYCVRQIRADFFLVQRMQFSVLYRVSARSMGSAGSRYSIDRPAAWDQPVRGIVSIGPQHGISPAYCRISAGSAGAPTVNSRACRLITEFRSSCGQAIRFDMQLPVRHKNSDLYIKFY